MQAHLEEGALPNDDRKLTNFIAGALVGKQITGETTPVHRGRPDHFDLEGPLRSLLRYEQLMFKFLATGEARDVCR